MHPENAIDNGDFIKILVYKFILVTLLPVAKNKNSIFLYDLPKILQMIRSQHPAVYTFFVLCYNGNK